MRLITYDDDDDLDVALSNLSLELIEALRLRDYWKDRALKAEQSAEDNLSSCEQTIPVVITTVVDDSFAAKLQAAIEEAKQREQQQSINEHISGLSKREYPLRFMPNAETVGKPQNNSGKSDTQGYAETTQANAQSVSEKPKAQDTLKRKPLHWRQYDFQNIESQFMGVQFAVFPDNDGTYNASCIIPMRRPEYAKNFATLDDAKQYAETVMLERVIRNYFEKG